MRLDRFLTEIELSGDFAVGSAVDDQTRDLKLALSERFDAGHIGLARSRASVDVVSEPAELALGGVAVAERAAPLQLGGGGLEFDYGPLPIAQLRERASSEGPGNGRPHGNADLVGEGGGCERVRGGLH